MAHRNRDYNQLKRHQNRDTQLWAFNRAQQDTGQRNTAHCLLLQQTLSWIFQQRYSTEPRATSGTHSPPGHGVLSQTWSRQAWKQHRAMSLGPASLPGQVRGTPNIRGLRDPPLPHSAAASAPLQPRAPTRHWHHLPRIGAIPPCPHPGPRHPPRPWSPAPAGGPTAVAAPPDPAPGPRPRSASPPAPQDGGERDPRLADFREMPGQDPSGRPERCLSEQPGVDEGAPAAPRRPSRVPPPGFRSRVPRG